MEPRLQTDDEVEDEFDAKGCWDSAVITSYLPVGYRANRRNPDKRKSKGASKEQVSNRYQPFDLVEWGDLNGGTVILPMARAPYNMQCIVSLTREL